MTIENTIDLPIKDIVTICTMLLDNTAYDNNKAIIIVNKISDKLKTLDHYQVASYLDVLTGRDKNYWVPM